MTACDPIFALIAAEARAYERYDAAKMDSAQKKADAEWSRARNAILDCIPTTHEGAVALLAHALAELSDDFDDLHQYQNLKNVLRALQGAKPKPRRQRLPANVVPLFRALPRPSEAAAPPNISA